VQQPKARPRARCCNSDGPYFAGSFIYWKTKFDVLDTVIDASSSTELMSGYAVPKYVKEEAGDPSKTSLLESFDSLCS
jgi:hypothetical protein